MRRAGLVDEEGLPTDPRRIVCLRGKPPEVIAARLQELGYRCVAVGRLTPPDADGRQFNQSSTIFRYDDPDSSTVHFVRVDHLGHQNDFNNGRAGGVPHAHVDTCDSSQPASPDRQGNVPTDADGEPLTQDQNYEQRYEPAAVTHDDEHNPVSRPGSGQPGEADTMDDWAQSIHHPLG